MAEDRLFPFIALVCILCWLLARSGRLGPRSSLFLSRGAVAILVIGLVMALLMAFGGWSA